MHLVTADQGLVMGSCRSDSRSASGPLPLLPCMTSESSPATVGDLKDNPEQQFQNPLYRDGGKMRGSHPSFSGICVKNHNHTSVLNFGNAEKLKNMTFIYFYADPKCVCVNMFSSS